MPGKRCLLMIKFSSFIKDQEYYYETKDQHQGDLIKKIYTQ